MNPLRDVPMPPSVEALRRTEKGWPVPYVAAREGELPYVLVRDRELGCRVISEHREHMDGTPILGQMAMCRSRRVIKERRCQVCVKALPPHPWIVCMAAGEMDSLPLIREPWACIACLSYALQVCPGLLGLQHRGPLRVWHLHEWKVVGTTTDLDGLRRDGLVAPECPTRGLWTGYLKIQPTRIIADASAADFVAWAGGQR